MASTKLRLDPRYNSYIIGGILLVLIVLLVFWISDDFEKVKETRNLGYTKEAHLNPYLAAELFLQRLQQNTRQSLDYLIALNEAAPEDTLFILNDRPILERQSERIRAWMYNGGHLVLAATDIWDTANGTSEDEFLNSFGVQLHNYNEYIESQQSEDEAYENDESTADQPDIEVNTNELIGETQSNANGSSDKDSSTETEDTAKKEDTTTEASECALYNDTELAELTYDSDQPPITIDFNRTRHLIDSSGDAIYSAAHEPNHILQYEYGEGMLTVLTNYSQWNNYAIADYDHAFLLWLLSHNSGTTWFIYDTDSDSLMSLLWNSSRYLIISLAALLMFYLWSQSRRFGPMLEAGEKPRRSLLEHLSAVTRFQWRGKDFQYELSTARHDIRYRLAHRHIEFSLSNGKPHSKSAPLFNDAAITLISERSRLNKVTVDWALNGEAPKKDHELVELAQALNQIRNNL